MKWGFNWDLGPFEMWDAVGLEESVNRMREEGETIPQWVEEMLQSGKTAFYQTEDGKTRVFAIGGKYEEVKEHQKAISLARLKEQGKKIFGNRGASLIDLGDDIACLEIHSPNKHWGRK